MAQSISCENMSSSAVADKAINLVCKDLFRMGDRDLHGTSWKFDRSSIIVMKSGKVTGKGFGHEIL
jgi:hypothetical protein